MNFVITINNHLEMAAYSESSDTDVESQTESDHELSDDEREERIYQEHLRHRQEYILQEKKKNLDRIKIGDKIDYSKKKLNHRTGNLEYDSDMAAVEDLVNVENDIENEEKQIIVHNYYVSRIQSYWNYAKNLIRTMSIEERKERNPGIVGFELSNTYPVNSKIETRIEEEIKGIRERLGDNPEIFTMHPYFYIFVLIAAYSCGADPFKLVPQYLKVIDKDAKKQHYPLINDVGLFGYNTWLYAFFNGVFLIGFPKDDTHFDYLVGCPYAFVIHDIKHTTSILKDLDQEYFSLAKKIYYWILNAKSFTTNDRLFHLLMLWLNIHEFTQHSIKHKYIPIRSKEQEREMDRTIVDKIHIQTHYIVKIIDNSSLTNTKDVDKSFIITEIAPKYQKLRMTRNMEYYEKELYAVSAEFANDHDALIASKWRGFRFGMSKSKIVQCYSYAFWYHYKITNLFLWEHSDNL